MCKSPPTLTQTQTFGHLIPGKRATMKRPQERRTQISKFKVNKSNGMRSIKLKADEEIKQIEYFWCKKSIKNSY